MIVFDNGNSSGCSLCCENLYMHMKIHCTCIYICMIIHDLSVFKGELGLLFICAGLLRCGLFMEAWNKTNSLSTEVVRIVNYNIALT